MPLRASAVISALALACLAAPAMAQSAKVYAYESQANYCPAGLQPVTISGVICCGTPNQTQSYQQVMRHPVAKVRHRTYTATSHLNCPVGEKGCY
jgi:ABC-type sugar transport system substrate-binding protein